MTFQGGVVLSGSPGGSLCDPLFSRGVPKHIQSPIYQYTIVFVAFVASQKIFLPPLGGRKLLGGQKFQNSRGGRGQNQGGDSPIFRPQGGINRFHFQGGDILIVTFSGGG